MSMWNTSVNLQEVKRLTCFSKLKISCHPRCFPVVTWCLGLMDDLLEEILYLRIRLLNPMKTGEYVSSQWVQVFSNFSAWPVLYSIRTFQRHMAAMCLRENAIPNRLLLGTSTISVSSKYPKCMEEYPPWNYLTAKAPENGWLEDDSCPFGMAS